MVFVNFSNPFLRDWLRIFGANHAQQLKNLADALPEQAQRARKLEKDAAMKAGRLPRPLAAVVDLDEVLLSNIHENVYHPEGAPCEGDAKADAPQAGAAAPVEIHTQAAGAPQANSEANGEANGEAKAPGTEAHAALPARVAELPPELRQAYADYEADSVAAIKEPSLEASRKVVETLKRLAELKQKTDEAKSAARAATAPAFYASDFFQGPDGKVWPRGEHRLAPLLPGARDLLAALRCEGLEIFIVTGRLEGLREVTVESLVHVGLAGAGPGALLDAEALRRLGGPLVMCPSAAEATPTIQPFKEGRRRDISATHRILMNIGDQVSDMGAYGDVQAYLPHPFYVTP